jgi:hypothetical protein
MQKTNLPRQEMLIMVNDIISKIWQFSDTFLPKDFQKPRLLEHASPVPWCVIVEVPEGIAAIFVSTGRQDEDGELIAKIYLDEVKHFSMVGFYPKMEEFKATLSDYQIQHFLPSLVEMFEEIK